MVSIGEIFSKAVTEDPTRPIVTWYDDATGDRTELSGVTLTNWVAKTANLLVEATGLDQGDTAVVELPAHWQTAAVLLGCWSAGVVVDLGATEEPADVAFVAAARLEPDGRVRGAGPAPRPVAATDRFALALLPMAGRLRVVPQGYVDYLAEVLGQGDRFSPYAKVGSTDAATRRPTALTHGELAALATGRAATLGLEGGGRVLIDTGRHPDPLDWLLAPLAVGASTVLCANLDPAKLDQRVRDERVTVTLVDQPPTN